MWIVFYCFFIALIKAQEDSIELRTKCFAMIRMREASMVRQSKGVLAYYYGAQRHRWRAENG